MSNLTVDLRPAERPSVKRTSTSRGAARRFRRVRAAAVRYLSAISLTFFVRSPWVGLAALAVLASVRPQLAVAGVAASVLARLTADRLRASRALLDSGLVELNGWFVGLACCTFYTAGPGLVAALLLGGLLTAVLSIVMHRVLATWDVPLLVAPYVPAFWLMAAAVAAFPWTHGAALVVSASPDSPWLLVTIGGLRGLGEIFFMPDARVGVGLAAAASIADRRLGIAMILASIASVGVGYAAGSPLWQVQQGLAGFSAALIAVAALRKFGGLGPLAVGVVIVTSPFFESAALRLTAVFGVPALSTAFVGFAWAAVLVTPVREASPTGIAGWSAGSGWRLFEHRVTANATGTDDYRLT